MSSFSFGLAGAPTTTALCFGPVLLSVLLAVFRPDSSARLEAGLPLPLSLPPPAGTVAAAAIAPFIYRSTADTMAYTFVFLQMRSLELFWGPRRFRRAVLAALGAGAALTLLYGHLAVLARAVLGAAVPAVTVTPGPAALATVLVVNYLVSVPVTYRKKLVLVCPGLDWMPTLSISSSSKAWMPLLLTSFTSSRFAILAGLTLLLIRGDLSAERSAEKDQQEKDN